MPLILFRIDERLLHGQVLVGWGNRLGIERYVVVDDALTRSPWEQELYASGLPRGVDALFLTPEETIARFAELDDRATRSALLTRGTGAMRRLAEAGLLRDRKVNVGGLHAGPGRERRLDFVYLGDDEVEDLRAIRPLVAKLTARDLPTAAEVPAERLLA